MLPDFVRPLPRAYLVPPRASNRERQNAQYKAQQAKRRLEDTAAPPASSSFNIPSFPPPLQFAYPPAHPEHGEIVLTSWSPVLKRWEHTYASGMKLSEASRQTEAPRRFEAPQETGAQVLAGSVKRRRSSSPPSHDREQGRQKRQRTGL